MIEVLLLIVPISSDMQERLKKIPSTKKGESENNKVL